MIVLSDSLPDLRIFSSGNSPWSNTPFSLDNSIYSIQLEEDGVELIFYKMGVRPKEERRPPEKQYYWQERDRDKYSVRRAE